jgi:hypothetical protein
MSDKFSESGEQGEVRRKYVVDRWQDLADNVSTRVDAMVAFLMLVNSGGAIAVLSFMGAMKTLHPVPGAPVMLGVFLVGIVFVGALRFLHYYRIVWLFRAWRRDATEFFEDRIGWDDLLTNDRHRSRRFWLADVIGILAFACFLAGIGLGYRAFF